MPLSKRDRYLQKYASHKRRMAAMSAEELTAWKSRISATDKRSKERVAAARTPEDTETFRQKQNTRKRREKRKRIEAMSPKDLVAYKARVQEKNQQQQVRRNTTFTPEQMDAYKSKMTAARIRFQKRHGVMAYKDSKLRLRFAITWDDYVNIRDKQKNLCALCKEPEEGKMLAVDHCHTTGRIRGLLCVRCNWTLGKIEKKGDPALVNHRLGQRSNRRIRAYLK